MSGGRWFLLICLGAAVLGAARASAHPADEVIPRIELRIEITESQIDFAAFFPAGVFLEDVVERESLEAYRSMDEAQRAERLETYFNGNHPVTVDGIEVRPVLDKVELYVPDPFFASEMSEKERAREFGTFTVALRYETKGKPGRVSFVWQRYLESVLPPPSARGSSKADRERREAEEAGEQEADGEGTRASPGAAEDQNEAGAQRASNTDPVIAVLSTAWDRRAKLISFKEDEPEYVWHGGGSPALPDDLTVSAERQNATLPVPGLSLGLLGVGVVSVAGLGVAGCSGRLRWSSGAILLIAAAGCLGVGWVEVELPWERQLERPADERALAVFESLHRNIYRAFDHDSESAIYDTLAQSVGGSELEKIYGNIYQSLIMEEQGGAVARVRATDILEKKVVPEPERGPEAGKEGFHVRCRWRVHGQVRHWGHSHNRTNEFEAIYAVAPRAGAWKIVGSRVLQQERLPDDAISVREP